MDNVLENILKSDNSGSIDTGIKPIITLIDSPNVTRNNGCETVFEGKFFIPAGKTAVVTGTMLNGFGGGGLPGNNGVGILLGDNNFGEGQWDYTVDLGNSFDPGNGSKYSLSVKLDNDEIQTILIERYDYHSIYYDQAPC